MTKQKAQPVEQLSSTSIIGDSAGRPEVIVEFLFDHGLLFISLRNIGDRPAIGVSVKFDKKIVGPDRKKDISALPLFRNLEFLGPGTLTFADNAGTSKSISHHARCAGYARRI
ncbi:MAG TPA: hypothetical protein VEM96_12995 [Pyrinomonadaceae bacterium]|nr:hypothetical protein [Pyrinomonadaceae bacterium]